MDSIYAAAVAADATDEPHRETQARQVSGHIEWCASQKRTDGKYVPENLADANCGRA